MKSQPIKDLVLAITYSCNSRCQFCDIWKKKKAYTTKPQDYLKLPRNIQNVNISGGEPFMREDLAEIVRTIVGRCPQADIVISTNGLFPEAVLKQMPAIIKIKGDVGVAVSIDGLKKTHERIRGVRNGFDKAFETLQILRNLRVKNLKIAFTLSSNNWQDLPKVYQLAKYLQAQFSLALVHNSEHYFQKKDNKLENRQALSQAIAWLARQEIKGVWPKKQWLRAYFAHGADCFIKHSHRILPDYSGYSSLFIDPDGQIYPSTAWNLKLGKLQEINSWRKFIASAQAKLLTESQAPASWMICTARQAIRKHPFKVGFWIFKSKFFKV